MGRLRIGAGDFTWAIQAARDLLARKNPYASPLQLYPLTSALFGLPFVSLKPEVAAGVFYGISSALLAFGVTRSGYHHLLIFLAYPYWAGILTAQWTPLIMASAFLSFLGPASMAKPQLGLPIALTYFGKKSVGLCLLVALLSFIVLPQWVSLWLTQLGRYSRFVPLLVFPGFLLVLTLLRYKESEARLLFIAACMPQRWFYDPFLLWLIPRTRRQIVYTAGLSWVPGIWRWFFQPHSFTQVGRWIVLWMYLPMLVVLLLHRPPSADFQENVSSGM
jgi:hypothetical protein